MNGPVLVLNQNYEPLNICNQRRALVLVDRGKAEVLEHGRHILRSTAHNFRAPSVIRLIYLIKRPRPKARLCRKEVFIRDSHMCMYCGIRGRDLTLDHVMPRHRGGKHTWENLVSACRSCNHRKGGKTLDESNMRLLRHPFQPKVSTYYILHQYLNTNGEWRKFIPEWEAQTISA